MALRRVPGPRRMAILNDPDIARWYANGNHSPFRTA
jgi:hypothetical protein